MLQKYHFQIGMQHRQQKGHCVRDLKTQVILFPSPTPPLSSGKFQATKKVKIWSKRTILSNQIGF